MCIRDRGCCLFGIPPHLAGQYQKALEARPFDRKDVRLLSLVRDSGTKSAINESVSLKAANLGDSKGPITNLAQIESVLRAASGTTVVLVSHVEGTNFVIRDAAQKLVSSMPIDSVRALASKYNVEPVSYTHLQILLRNQANLSNASKRTGTQNELAESLRSNGTLRDH